MIEFGHIDLPDTDLASLRFTSREQCYQQLPEIQQFYNEHNSSIYQMFDADCPDWIIELPSKLPKDFSNYVTSAVKIEPGQTVPFHVDKHYLLKSKFGECNSYRYLIFLEDWKSGHYYEIFNQPFVKWRKGDWIKFAQADWHLAGNMGIEPFYSAQVTVKGIT